MKLPSVYDCSIIGVPTHTDPAGNLSIAQNGTSLPFDIRRVFYIYDIPAGRDRGAHAHRSCHQFLIAAGGAFEVELDDGVNRRTVSLNRPYYGLHIPPGIWAAEKGFSSGAICLVLTSQEYNPEDYIRDYDVFLALRGLQPAEPDTP
jgi:hypothetical protein